jgi:hypothetical protein
MSNSETQSHRLDLYSLSARRVSEPDDPPPDTALTFTVETVDNDRAVLNVAGTGLPLP